MEAKPFEGVLGNNCELRLLEFLLPLDDLKFNISELAEESGVSRVTTGRVAKKFTEWNILKVHDGKNLKYSINPESPLVKCIINFNDAILEEILGEEKILEINDYIIGRNQELLENQMLEKTIPKYFLENSETRESVEDERIPCRYDFGDVEKGRVQYVTDVAGGAG